MLLALLAGSSGAQAQAGYKPGDVARDFSLKNVDGKQVSLASFPDAKGFIVVFTCNHCPFAQLYEERILDLDKAFRPKGYPVIAINPNDPKQVPDDSFENMVKQAKAAKYTFPYLLDETQAIARAYGATRTPHVFVLEKTAQGQAIVRYIGAIDDNAQDERQARTRYVAEAVEALLKGQPVGTALTKAIGCGIKWM